MGKAGVNKTLIGAIAAIGITATIMWHKISEQSKYVAANAEEFYKYHKDLKQGDTLHIQGTITLDTSELSIPFSIIGTQDFDKVYQGSTIITRQHGTLFRFTAPCLISGVRIFNRAYTGSLDHCIKESTGIHLVKNVNNTTIVNCWIDGFSKHNIWIEGNGNRVTRCWLSNSRMAGYGYGAWMGSANGSANIIDSCIVWGCASGIDAGGHLFDLYAIGNTITEPITLKAIGRHGSSSTPQGTRGGLSTYIESNNIQSGAVTLPLPRYDTGSRVVIKDNINTSLELIYKGGTVIGSAYEVARKPSQEGALVTYSNNQFNTYRPSTFIASPLEGVVPMTVSVSNRGAGSGVSMYTFGNNLRIANSTSYTLTNPTRTLIKQRQINNFYLSDALSKAVIARPIATAPIATGYFTDSYNGGKRGMAFIYIVANIYNGKTLVSSDTLLKDDVANNGWRYFNVVLPSKECRISAGFKVSANISTTDLCELKIFIDDVFLFNHNKQVSNGDFEIKGETYKDGFIHYYRPVGLTTGISVQQTSEEAYSGIYSVMLRLPYIEGSKHVWQKGTGAAVEFY